MIRDVPKARAASGGEENGWRRRSITTATLGLDLVSAYGGDRRMTTADHRLIRKHREERGSLFHSDLLHSMTHRHFEPERAESLWQEILSHEDRLSVRLGRNIRMTVAALDYLSSITGDLDMTVLISESCVARCRASLCATA